MQTEPKKQKKNKNNHLDRPAHDFIPSHTIFFLRVRRLAPHVCGAVVFRSYGGNEFLVTFICFLAGSKDIVMLNNTFLL